MGNKNPKRDEKELADAPAKDVVDKLKEAVREEVAKKEK